MTYLLRALDMVKNTILKPENGARPGNTEIVILITDGVWVTLLFCPTTSNEFLFPSISANRGGDPAIPATELKAAGSRIITIGVGSQLDVSYLQQIASSDSDILLSLSFSNLYQLLPNIQDQLACESYEKEKGLWESELLCLW